MIAVARKIIIMLNAMIRQNALQSINMNTLASEVCIGTIVPKPDADASNWPRGPKHVMCDDCLPVECPVYACHLHTRKRRSFEGQRSQILDF